MTGQSISGTRVIEPLDLTLTAEALFVLDRVGDVYRYDLADEIWTLDRYDRPIRDLSSHYFVALASQSDTRYLLEISYSFGVVYQPEQRERLWPVPEGYVVDMVAQDDSFYTLYRPYTSPVGAISRFLSQEGIFVDVPLPLEVTQPRQLKFSQGSLYTLDQAGQRLSQISLRGNCGGSGCFLSR